MRGIEYPFSQAHDESQESVYSTKIQKNNHQVDYENNKNIKSNTSHWIEKTTKINKKTKMTDEN